jgi:D-glycero-alpha-D-manno-heptose 1-phosphate guanylyltransferase
MPNATPDPIDAIVLAGGFGTRLKDVLPDRQKVTAAVGGSPFLSRLIDWLGEAGIARIVLAAGHRADDVKAVAEQHAGGPAQVLVATESNPLGTGGAARLALNLTTSDPLFVLNGDSFARIDIAAFRQFHSQRRAACSIALVTAPDPSRYGTVDVTANGEVRSFREKQTGSKAAAINAGVYLFDRATLAHLPEDQPLSLERDVFPGLVGNGLYATHFDAPFIDIGTPASLLEAKSFFGEIK